jgi:hypothetical protein
MINHILQMLGNRSEVLPRRLTTRRSWRCLPSKKDEKFLPRAVPVGSIDQYFSTVELQACVFLLGMRTFALSPVIGSSGLYLSIRSVAARA